MSKIYVVYAVNNGANIPLVHRCFNKVINARGADTYDDCTPLEMALHLMALNKDLEKNPAFKLQHPNGKTYAFLKNCIGTYDVFEECSSDKKE